MSVYTFSIAADFPNGLNETSLYDELKYDYDFVDLVGVSASEDTCSISFSVDLTPEQEASLNTAVAAHDGQPKPFVKKHFEKEFHNTRLVRETWWALSAGGALSRKVEETIYTYAGSRLMSEDFTQYNRDGSVAQARSWVFKQQKIGTTLVVRKVEQ